MNPLFDYMTDDEYDVAVESAVFENTALRFENAFNIAEMNHKLSMSNIETKAIVENYNDYDLEKMYTREVQMYTESVKEIWDKFINWLKGIWAALLGKVKLVKKNELGDDEIELPADPNGLVKFSQELRSKIKQFKETHVDGNEGVISIVFGGIAATGLVAFTVNGIKKNVPKKTKMTIKDAAEACENVANESGELSKIAQDIKNKAEDANNSEEKKKAFGFVREAITKMVNSLQSLSSEIFSKINKKNNQTTEAEPSKENDSATSEEKNQDSTQSQDDSSKPDESSNNDSNASSDKGDDNKTSNDNGNNNQESNSNDDKKHIKIPADWDKMDFDKRRKFLKNAGVSNKSATRLSNMKRSDVVKDTGSRTSGTNSIAVAFEHAISDSKRIFEGFMDAVNLDIDAYLTEASGEDYKELQELAASLID